tara:strand:- start:75 stop:314 length:240 start_codon:yes stop_codon:yes gene_type:complete
MLHYSDNYKISNYKINMERLANIKELKEKIKELQSLLEDFINLHESKKNKIINLEIEIKEIKQNMNKYLDEIEELIDVK